VVPLSQDQALDHDQRPQPAVAASHETHKLLKLGGAVEVENMGINAFITMAITPISWDVTYGITPQTYHSAPIKQSIPMIGRRLVAFRV